MHAEYFALISLILNLQFCAKANLSLHLILFVSVALDTVLHGPRLASQRRHSVSVCQTPTASQPPPLPSCPQRMQKMISVASNRDSEEDSLEDDDDSLCSGSASPRRSLPSDLSSPEAELSDLGGYSLNTPAMHANLHTEFIHSVSKKNRQRQ